MKPCLVVCYSRTGMTRKLADRIVDACGADLEQISDLKTRIGPLGYLRSSYEAITKNLPGILAPAKNPADYELVILGTPVWAGKVSAPMRSYINQHRGSFKRIAAFCTMGGSGGDKTLNEIEALCGKPLIARLVLTDAEIQNDRYQDKVLTFAQSTATEAVR